MKISLLVITFFQILICNSQIEPFLGLYDVDSCNFEELNGNLKIDTNSSNLWKIGVPHKIIFNSTLNENKVIITDTLFNYTINNHSKFTIKAKDYYVNSCNFNISFKHRIDSDTLKDGGFVEISIDNGQNWYNVINPEMPFQYQYSNSENFYASSDTLVNNSVGFSGYTTDWVISKFQWIISFPVKREINDSLLFRFNFISDSIENNREGWIIDDFKIQFAGVSELNEEKMDFYNLYPNPATNVIKIENNNIEIIELNLFDVSNKKIPINQKLKNEIDISKLKAGIYYIKIKTKNTEVLKKFIKE